MLYFIFHSNISHRIPEEPDKNDNMTKLSNFGTKIVMRKFQRLKI